MEFCNNWIDMHRLYIFLSFFLILFFNFSYGDLPHQGALGPEFYRVKRVRKGGTAQKGYLYGFRASYERIGRCLIYWGLETAYASGKLHGSSGLGNHLKSRFSDFCFEGRFGFTFQGTTGCQAQLTPFIGYGYFQEKNNYIHPTPLHVHFRNTFNYFAFGVLTKAYIRSFLTVGLNITGRASLNGKVKVTHDPEFDNSTLHYENELQGRAAVPISYLMHLCRRPIQLRFTPFYEYRHYGRHHNVPFDFPDTRIKIFGANFQLVFMF